MVYKYSDVISLNTVNSEKLVEITLTSVNGNQSSSLKWTNNLSL